MKNIKISNVKTNKTSKKRYKLLNIKDNKNNFKILLKYIFYSIIVIALIVLIYILINYIPQLIKKEYTFLGKLKNILDKDELLVNEMMNKHTTFKLGGPAKFFIIPHTRDKIIKIIKLCKEYNIEYFILGNGSNLLVSDKGYDGLVIKINEDNFADLNVKALDEKNYKITVGGGMLMKTLAIKMCLLSLSGLEDIIDIPGTIGGGIIMNAAFTGVKGIISHSLDKVKVITTEGEIKEFSKIECQLRYRGSMLKDNKYIIIEATFNLVKSDKMVIQKDLSDNTSKRYSKQPMYFPSAGSFFVWDYKYGSLHKKYEECKLVGYKVGDAMLYIHNIAFIVNLGNAKSSDVYEVVTFIEKTMKKKYNIEMKREVIVIGSF